MQSFLVHDHVLLDSRFRSERHQDRIAIKFCLWIRVVLQLEDLLLHVGLIGEKTVFLVFDVGTSALWLYQLCELFMSKHHLLKPDDIRVEAIDVLLQELLTFDVAVLGIEDVVGGKPHAQKIFRLLHSNYNNAIP
jgi:hypothetical protein